MLKTDDVLIEHRLVHPAAQLPFIAREAGAMVIEVNPGPEAREGARA